MVKKIKGLFILTLFIAEILAGMHIIKYLYLIGGAAFMDQIPMPAPVH